MSLSLSLTKAAMARTRCRGTKKFAPAGPVSTAFLLYWSPHKYPPPPVKAMPRGADGV